MAFGVRLKDEATGVIISTLRNVATTPRTYVLPDQDITVTTIGGNIASLTNPSAVTFLRMNANNTVDALSASAFLTALGVDTGFWKTAGTTTLTGTVTTAFGSNPWILITGVTTGTDATSGLDFQANSLTTGYGMNLRSSSITSGRILRVASTSTAIDHTAGTSALVSVVSSGANSTSSKTAIGQQILMTNTGTSSTNIGLYISATGATTNTAIQAVGNLVQTGKYNLTGSTLSGGSIADNWLNITGTMPTTMTAQTNAVNFDVTGAGSSSQISFALRVAYNAGYTGSSPNGTANLRNSNAGTNTTAPTMNAIVGNVGNSAFSTATTTGHNYGTISQAFGGNLNVGVIGQAQTNKNSAINYGVVGLARNTGSSPQEVGGYFALFSDATALPTGVSAALICNNGTSTSDIFKVRDNGTDVWSIPDGGALTAAEGSNIVFGTSTGTKIATSTSQKISFWNKTPIVQPTTGITGATLTGGGGTTITSTDTFGGYTLQQLAAIIINTGLAA